MILTRRWLANHWLPQLPSVRTLLGNITIHSTYRCTAEDFWYCVPVQAWCTLWQVIKVWEGKAPKEYSFWARKGIHFQGAYCQRVGRDLPRQIQVKLYKIFSSFAGVFNSINMMFSGGNQSALPKLSKLFDY